MSSVLLLFYSWFTKTIIMVGRFCYPFLNAKLKSIIDDRKNSLNQIKAVPFNNPIWFHCASGEFEYIKPLIRELKIHYPQCKILVTYVSPSSAKSIQSFAGVDYSLPLPWESRKYFESFFSHIQPQALLVARTDLWFGWLYQCHKRHIPILLFSATFSEGTKKTSALIRPWMKLALSFMNSIYTVGQDDLNNLMQITKHPLASVQGDTRYDQVLYRLKQGNPLPTNTRHFEKAKTLIAGSTWPEDEQQLIPAFAETMNLIEGIKLIIAPHEVNEKHLLFLESLIGDNKLRSCRLSAGLFNPNKHDVLIVDRIGILADLYQLGCCAFVGGSFKKQVHSVMEALGWGLPVIVGPFYKNNREAIEFSQIKLDEEIKMVNIVTDTSSFVKSLHPLLTVDEPCAKIQEEFNKRVGASKKVIQWIEAHAKI